MVAIDIRAAGKRDSLGDRPEFRLGAYGFRFEEQGFADSLFDSRQRLLGLLKSEVPRHPLNAADLDSDRAAARTVELSQNDALPRSKQHCGIPNLETQSLAHEHATHV